MNTMSADNERNRKIAERLCPSKGGDVCIICGWALQGLKWYEHCEAPDFFRSVAMRDLLQQKLLEEGWIIIKLYATQDGIFMAIGKGDQLHGFCDTRERIWPLAYLKAHGLEES